MNGQLVVWICFSMMTIAGLGLIIFLLCLLIDNYKLTKHVMAELGQTKALLIFEESIKPSFFENASKQFIIFVKSLKHRLHKQIEILTSYWHSSNSECSDQTTSDITGNLTEDDITILNEANQALEKLSKKSAHRVLKMKVVKHLTYPSDED